MDTVKVDRYVAEKWDDDIVPQLVDFLPRSDFRARLDDKGAMRAVLERVPVRLIENERLGALGAASWYLQQRQDRISR